MKILILSEGDAETWDSWSGISKSVVDHLRKAGHTVLTGDVDLYGAARWWGIARAFRPEKSRWRSTYRLGADSFRRRSRVAARHIARHRDADVIIQMGATFEPLGRGDIPYVLYCDSNIRVADRWRASGVTYATPLSELERGQIADREAGVYANASLIFTISEQLRRAFIEDFGLPENQVHTIHAGPNFENHSILNGPPPNRSRTPRKVLFVGKDFQRKGGAVLLEAFRVVRSRCPDAELLIVGPQSLEAQGPGVTLVGRIDKDTPEGAARLKEIYQEADIFCLPTRFEPLGIVFLEAMSYGLPCIGTDHWAIPEMVADGETGLIVPVDDVPALASAIERLLTEPGLALRMGRAGFSRAGSHFTWDAVVDRMLGRIDEILTVGAAHA